MQRCLELAQRGAGYVAPNPMVGAVLVYQERIIGEGYHQRFGSPHAEVNCLDSVSAEDKIKIPGSVLYVSLEPCAHFGKTPPCTDLIIEHKIKNVVVGCKDPAAEVNGRGIEKLKSTGVNIQTGVLEDECMQLNRRFIIFHKEHRPYIILKWAETADKKMAGDSPDRLLISNEKTNRLVHKWRSEEMSILVGSGTAIVDNPELTTRLWQGISPVRLVIDMDLILPGSLRLFNDTAATIIFNTKRHSEDLDRNVISPLSGEREGKTFYYQVSRDANTVHQVLNALYLLQIQSVMVEGGLRLLQSFIDEGTWDEARIISNKQLTIGKGLPAPELSNAMVKEELKIGSDEIKIYYQKNVS